MDEEEFRKSTRNRKKRTFGDDFIDPTRPEFTAKPGGSMKRKKEGSQPIDIDSKPSPSPPSRAPPEKESEEVAENISKILARYKKQEEREEREMKRIEQNLFGESSRRGSEVKSQKNSMEKELEIEEDDEEMEESDGEICDDPDDKNYRPSRQRRKKPPLTMSGLHQILNQFERPNSPPPGPPEPSVTFSYSDQLTPEENAKLDEEASALIASIREASTLKILAKRQNGKTAFGEERQAEDAEINEFMRTAEPEMVQAISRRMSEDSRSSSSPPVRRSDRKQVAKTRVYSPEPEGERKKRAVEPEVSRKSSAEKSVEEPDYDIPSTSELILSSLEKVLEPKIEEATPTETLLEEPEAPPISEPLSFVENLENLLEDPKQEPIVEEEMKPETLIDSSSFEDSQEEKPEVILAPPIEDSHFMNEAPKCDYSPRNSPIPRMKIPPKPRKYPAGSTIETITIVKGPDGRILSKKKVITKLVAKVKKVPEGLEVGKEIQKEEQESVKQNGIVPMKEEIRMREEPVVLEPEVVEQEDPSRRWRFLEQPSTSSSSSPYQRPFKPTVNPKKRLNRVLTPKRHFLGAEEPIKDLPTTSSSRQNRWFTQRNVRSFGRDQLRPFGLKPPVNVFGQEIPDPVADSMEDAEVMERVKDMLKVKKARDEENLRQKRAMAKKLIFDEAHVYEYMNSEKFKESLEASGSEFNKLLNSPVPLQKVPEFSDSLFHTNRNLYENLERIRDQRRHQEHPKRVYRKGFQERWNEDNTVDFGELEEPEEAQQQGEQEEHTNKERAWIEVLQDINERWNGIASKIPTTIECHLCQAEMRLVLRRTRVGGVMKEYPAYRCLRKRCQTFRSIRKAFDISGIRGQPALHQDLFESPTDDFVMAEPKLEPIEQILQDVIRRHQEVTGENLGDAMVPMGYQKNIPAGDMNFQSTSGNPVDPMDDGDHQNF